MGGEGIGKIVRRGGEREETKANDGRHRGRPGGAFAFLDGPLSGIFGKIGIFGILRPKKKLVDQTGEAERPSPPEPLRIDGGGGFRGRELAQAPSC